VVCRGAWLYMEPRVFCTGRLKVVLNTTLVLWGGVHLIPLPMSNFCAFLLGYFFAVCLWFGWGGKAAGRWVCVGGVGVYLIPLCISNFRFYAQHCVRVIWVPTVQYNV